MKKLLQLLPHRDPVRFVKTVFVSSTTCAITQVSFEITPSLAMVVEAAAQSSVFIKTPTKSSQGMLTNMKHIELKSALNKKNYQIRTELQHYLEHYFSFKFSLMDNKTEIVCGEFSIIRQ